MIPPSTDIPPTRRERHAFVTTHWSVVQAARDPASPGAQEALQALCQAYWYPLYAYARRLGRAPHDAQDLTQEFFARLIARDFLRAADPGKGRFRAFLRVAFQRFMANEWDRARALKRGGARTPVRLDFASLESRYLMEAAPAEAADVLYQRRWALTLVERALGRLRSEYAEARRLEEFNSLKDSLTAGRGAVPYRELAARSGSTEGALRVAVHRLRRRFRDLFESEVAATVADPSEVEAEIREVLRILSG